ncbi:MAG: S41 family peptidase [Patescibacteria group bacterium]
MFKHRWFGQFSFLLALIATFALGGLAGARTVSDYPNTEAGKLLNTALGKPSDIDFGLYWDVYGKLENRFPKPINQQDLVYGAIRGTVEALGDRYSLFLSPDEAKRFFEDINGEFSGIGAEISQENEFFIIIAPLPDSPAEKAELKAQDIIVKVDGKESKDMQFGELINAIRGAKGSQVTLTIMREGFEEPKDFILTRDTITVPSMTYELREDGLGYIKMSQFSDDTVTEFEKAADDLNGKNAKGLILDLRNNPGGFLDSSIDISSFFIESGVVVIEERKGGDREEFKVTHEATLKDLPLVVLVNCGSASASEIVAGAIQDTERAKVVGVKTFGKGSVQEVEMLEDGSALRLTIAKWLTPKGREINGEGITPDIIIDQEVTDELDPQLDKAVELLTK